MKKLLVGLIFCVVLSACFLEKRQLLKAVKSGELKTVKELIDKGADVNTRDRDGWSLLHWSIYNNHDDISHFLIARGADVRSKTQHGKRVPPFFIDPDWTVLHAAARFRDLELLKLLIDKGADINAKDEGGRAVIHEAGNEGHWEIVRYLIDKGVSPNSKGSFPGRTVLHSASQHGNLRVVKYIVERGAHVNAKDYGGVTPLGLAHNAEIRAYLKRHGAKR